MLDDPKQNNSSRNEECAPLEELYLFASGNETLLGAKARSIRQHLSTCGACAGKARRASRHIDLWLRNALGKEVRSTALPSGKTEHPAAVPWGVWSGVPGDEIASFAPYYEGSQSSQVVLGGAGAPEPREPTSAKDPKGNSFAAVQRGVEKAEKELVASWVVRNIPLPSGAGVYLDAGSQALAVWANVVAQMKKSERIPLSVLTNNLMVLRDRMDSVAVPELNMINMQVAGDILDADHAAFYGEIMKTQILAANYRFAVVFIGASTVEFDQNGILLGYHAGNLERDAKALLFQCRAKIRVILATPSKIGNSGGLALDVLKIPRLDARAPVYLVSAEPQAGTAVAKRYAEAKRTLQDPAMQEALRKRGLTLHWVEIPTDGSNAKNEVFPDIQATATGAGHRRP